MLSEVESRSGRLLRRAASGVVVAVIAESANPSGAAATNSGAEAEQAAREIQDAGDRANDASQAMFDAESELDRLGLEIAAAEDDLAAANARAAAMRTELQALAERSFVNGGAASMPLLIDLDDANEELTAEHFAAVARGGAAVDLDELDALMSDIADAQADLEQGQEDATDAKENFEELKARAENEVVRLAEVEQRRVIDAQVQHELDRQRAVRAVGSGARGAVSAVVERWKWHGLPSPGHGHAPTPGAPPGPAGAAMRVST